MSSAIRYDENQADIIGAAFRALKTTKQEKMYVKA